ncbi:sulfurtransferase [Microbacterium sp. zg.Y1090]|uniref:sulfurtransferase n=1 Tax=Microbacterium wangruii TaxID=3049073 RepID=UPI00214CE190|nr:MULTISPECIES: sulfurtransferase [unclassified Microbacterium]MCR2817788.1 sulfurtransferase [Microbacterium sp. zg.Y1090]WIM28739.1 sulfurtransferase [Microbacterium sp. zg-Y1090]
MSLITPEALAALIAGPHSVRVLDVRWRLDRPDGRAEYLAGHVPGAVYVDLERELSAHGAPTEGRHPLPSTAQLGEAARRWGLDDGDTVVVYDDLSSLAAARAWWLLVDAGVADVRILDGALRGWIAAGLPLEQGAVVPSPGSVTLGRGLLPRLTMGAAAALAQTGVLLDVRAEERYRGETEPIDPRAGHIPGALSAPTTANVDADGRFLDPAALRERFTALGVTEGEPVGVYCGSGITASHAAFALTLAGFAPRLYPGSWSQWSQHPDRPVATGAEPGGGG